MTRRPVAFAAIQASPNLSLGLADMLEARIARGEYASGDKLPTEQSIVAATGVSRTVVREALATLRARGLITTQQGAGAFVADRAAQRHFTIRAEAADADTLHVLELRIGVEVEAAGLAAERRSEAQLAELRRRLDLVLVAKGEADVGAEEDFAFHRAILEAAGNPYFGRVFDVFGVVLIPRQRLRLDRMEAGELETYLGRLRREHALIVDGIAARDAARARRAMRRHLGRSLALFRARGIEVPA